MTIKQIPVKKRVKAPKTESLTIRLDPKMRFALEFVARINGQTITKVIERAVTEMAERTTIGENDGTFNKRNWKHYWDVNDGVRFIHVANDDLTHPSFEEDEIMDYIRSHWNYFSCNPDLRTLKRDSIEVLWPHINNLVELWKETRGSKRTVCSSRMRDLLRSAGILDAAWTVSDDMRYSVVDEADIVLPF
ncbi:hypothetical protein JRX38_14335 [Gluconobacter cerinus]|uniref:hypothetical protein n=1 Tax=Gluconobacter TaxID=441 RepID=UPI000AFFB0B4|nr:MULTISPECIES: hypothetical protein [Gluconobacter]MBM3099166.1 hypothetical protein [Gluconobacter cerinus]